MKYTKYRETSIIVKIFTEEFGISSFIVNNVRSAKAKFKPSYFEPLSLVELTCYYHANRDISRISEIKPLAPLHSLRQDIYKSSIIVFLAEVLNKVIIENDKNEPLFNFLYEAIISFDSQTVNNNFHLQLLLQLTPYLGFSVQNTNDFIKESNNPKFYDSKEHSDLLKSLINSSLDSEIKMSSKTRATILNDIIFYYQQHMGISKLKSLEVLSTIFR